MEANLKKYLVTVPEWCVGDVMGKLSSLGGWLGGAEYECGLVSIAARVPGESMVGFEEWLAQVSNGEGKIRENA